MAPTPRPPTAPAGQQTHPQRHPRLRLLGTVTGIGSLVLALLIMCLAWWLLLTFGGRDFLLTQVASRLPAGTTLEWQRAEGPASGPLTLYGLRFEQRSCPDRDGEPVPYGQCASPDLLSFIADRATVDPALLPLLGRRLRLDTLDIDNAVLTLPPAAENDAPFQLPSWPDVLPQIGPLPLALQADAIAVNGLRVDTPDGPLIDIHQIRGGLDVSDGLAEVRKLLVDSDRGRFSLDGRYAPREHYRVDLTGSAVLPAPPARTRPNFGFVARGDADHLDVVLTGFAPAPVRATLALRSGDPSDWRLQAQSSGLDPALLTGSGEAGIPVAFEFVADGSGGSAELHGHVSRDGFTLGLEPSTLRLDGQRLELDPLALELLDGRVAVRGYADFDEAGNPAAQLSLEASGLRWGGADANGDATPPIEADAGLDLSGRLQAWTLAGGATLARNGLNARVELDGSGDDARMQLHSLRASMPTGSLDGSGEIAWVPALSWQVAATLAGFDPGYFAPGWNGAVNGRLATHGSTGDNGALEATVVAERLGGQLRGGRPLDGNARFAMHGPPGDNPDAVASYDAEVALSLGESRIDATASVTSSLAVDARLSPLLLSDLLPGASGRISGQVNLSGSRTAPDIDIDLQADAVHLDGYAAEQASVRGRLPWSRGQGRLDIDARGVNAGVALDTLTARTSGHLASLQISANTQGPLIGALALEGNLEQYPAGWRGGLASLRLEPAQGPAWSLQSPTTFAWRGQDSWLVSQTCLASTGGGSLCLEADWPRQGLAATGSALPLSLAEPWLPARDDGQPWNLRGDIDLQAQLRPTGGAFTGSILATSDDGGIRFHQRARRDVVGYSGLRLEAGFNPQSIQGSLSLDIGDSGHVRGQLDTGWNAYSPLTGELSLDMDQLAWLELFSPDVVEPQGHLTGQLVLGGTRAEPALSGQARLEGFTTELPMLAIVLEDGNVHLDAREDGNATLTGSVRSGEGTLHLDGRLGWRGDAPLEIDVSGENVLVSHTRDLHAIASPDLQVRYAAGHPLEVTGTVTVPEAQMNLERLSDGVSASPDVVVLDPVDPEREPAMAMQLDLTLEMGDDVRLNGFGLEGTLGGRLRVRQYPGRDMHGTGSLQVGGRYKAYGQELRIARGNLIWSNDVVSDPVLDLRAERRIEAEELTAGIDVSGRASSPRVQVWTDPARDQSEALAYLTLGRSLSSVTGNEGRQIDAAAAALQAGGGLVASQLGAGLGLDDAGVSHSRALGGSVLGVGKQLSPRLYVGFGVSLLGTGQVLTLRYLLSRGFDMEIESSTLENRGSLNWRRERD